MSDPFTAINMNKPLNVNTGKVNTTVFERFPGHKKMVNLNKIRTFYRQGKHGI